MTETLRLLLLLAMAGALVTFLGSAVLFFGDERRRMTRALTKVLRGKPEAMILALGRGRGAGFNFQARELAVTWDKGAWCLVYRLEELMGAELSIDGQVTARVYRGEGRRALEQVVSTASQVTLRLVFDDARNPDFDLDLWGLGDEARRDAFAPADAIKEANRWVSRIDAILRHTAPPQGPAPGPEPQVAAPAQPVAQPAPPRPAPPPPEPEPAQEPMYVREPAPPPEPMFAPAPPPPPPRPAVRVKPKTDPETLSLFPDEEDDDPPWDPQLRGDSNN